MNQLLAKSARGGRPPRTLLEHTCDVVDAFVAMFGTQDSPSHLARRWAAFFKLQNATEFICNGLASAWLHDWGKANDGFQYALDGSAQQFLRHEHLSGMLIHIPVVRTWLDNRPDLDQDVILAAVVTHHLKCAIESLGRFEGDASLPMRVRWDHQDFQRLLERTCLALGLPAPPTLDVQRIWCFQPRPGEFDAATHLSSVKQRLDDLDLVLEDDPARRRLLWAVRSALIAADAAGSGLVREGHPVTKWIADAFAEQKLLTGEYINQNVIEPRISQLREKGRFEKWSEFQLACDTLPDRALLLAPCGSGKTLAAWRWVAARLRSKPAARAIFLYPTRGTATEGFRDYVAWAPETDASLLHGTSEYDLDGLFGDVDDNRAGKSFETKARLFALKQWPKRVFSATVDQFFAFLQHAYGPLCQLPLLADAVVVVDEVHSFDRGMFSALQELLKAFDVPVLCMTATLPQERQKALENCGLHVYPCEMPADLARSADYPRYRARRVDAQTARTLVREALEAKARVLWVVNKVKRCQNLARDFAADLSAEHLTTQEGASLYCYHSRYKLEHRKRQHESVVEAFRPDAERNSGVLAVTTQVCEMSLDLDADLVVTEVAPITSMIQRMGRGCREPLPRNGRYADILIYTPDDERPYTAGQLAGAETFVNHIAEKQTVSQADLEQELAQSPKQILLGKNCRFLDSGPWATAGEEDFRDTEEFTTQALLPDEVEDYLSLVRNKAIAWKADGLVLPAPSHLAKQSDPRLPSYLHIAEPDRYCKTLGYVDEPLFPKTWIV